MISSHWIFYFSDYTYETLKLLIEDLEDDQYLQAYFDYNDWKEQRITNAEKNFHL